MQKIQNHLESFPDASVIGVDRDPLVQSSLYQPDFKSFIAQERLKLLTSRFSTLEKDLRIAISQRSKIHSADAVLFDLGYSNNQVNLHNLIISVCILI